LQPQGCDLQIFYKDRADLIFEVGFVGLNWISNPNPKMVSRPILDHCWATCISHTPGGSPMCEEECSKITLIAIIPSPP